MIVQTIQLLGMLILVTVGPMIERAMSDPDISFRLRWHGRRIHQLARYRIHEFGIAVENVVGIYQAEEYLRHQAKKDRRYRGTDA